MRAGYIRRVGPSIYSWLPLGIAVVRTIERVVRDEMTAIGAGSAVSGPDPARDLRSERALGRLRRHAVPPIARGIELGHVFQLGRRCAEAFGLQALGPDGTPVRITMGSYGLGITRAVAALAEQTHDEKGLCWPRSVSPADVHVVATGRDDAPFQAAERVVADLVANGTRVLFDDRRGVSPGVKFADAELLGIPTIVIVGRGLAGGVVEVRDRRSGERRDVPLDTVAVAVR